MLTLLVDFADDVSAFNVFRYITFRTGGALITSAVIVFIFGPRDHRLAARPARQGPADPRRRSADAFQEGRHADHGRADDPLGHHRARRCSGPTSSASMSGWCCWWRSASAPIGFYDDYLKVTKQSHLGFSGRARLGIEFVIAGIAAYVHHAHRPGAVLLVADLPFIKDFLLNLGWFFIPLRLHRHRRRRQCSEPDRRAGRTGDRADHDRGGLLRRHRLPLGQRGLRRLSADPFRAGHRRTRRRPRRGDRRRARLPVVQRAAGRDLHGRHRLAGAWAA